ncbi:MAG: hypothetical protein HPPSJP_2620 [Candidatus Hepatoplasma scabrum]|nr:MAG: hypothetical protein HPPSJP_2620 [Candidatus Hepatoplasma sp.]
MKYIIQSESFFIKKEEVENIIKFANFKREQIFIFDYTENQFARAFDQYLSNSIFGEKKIIIINNCLFLEKKILDKKFIKKINILFNAKNDNFLIFKTNKLSKNNLFLNEFLKAKKINLIYKQIPSKMEINKFLREKLKQDNLFFDSYKINKILGYVKYDYDILHNELKKISLLKDKSITNDLDLIIYDYVGENIFKLYDSLLAKNISNLSKILNSLKTKNISPIMIIEYLIKELQYLLLIKNYQNLKLKQKTSILDLNLNKYRLKKIIENANNYSYQYIEEIINKLIKSLILFKSNYSSTNYQLFIAKFILLSSQL